MNDNVSHTIERLYTHFLMRDVVYLVAGGLVLTVGIYAVQGCICYECVNWPFAVSFIFASYFLGYLIQNGCRMIGVVKIKHLTPSRFKDNDVCMVDNFAKLVGPVGMREYERIVFQKHIGAAIGPSCLICFVAFGFLVWANPTRLHIATAATFLILGIVCLTLNRKMWNVQNKVLTDFSPD